MQKTDLKMTAAGFKTTDDLVDATINLLDENDYHFLAIALAQELVYHRSDQDKVTLIKEYVQLV
ncbi:MULTISPECIES: hypothetical protein [Lacticaseibacillus]|uniref:Uncharacterized protein n=1 Tax=Lacticaseibacillus casei DSM 20011 = JCM 1134 = ATCC 393 TaxID=1423732 RepID=A0AAD1APH5_LACCA|nr:hypothetical protein [Lacticaseibacillus casei]MBI6596658.1 hypothetical protein [Lacticaseibacillus casei]MBO1480363.1 hypothetical protein [Lacticaseibacillus casei]MBO2415628.1 hypothetical protein [Lacticaseibacillus casei]MCK2079987.1 hypothetical protein [Lacticaseibacillus casei]MDZ5495608.1 hypothetical protein [Lacticaseibacillus casei]